MAQEGSFDTNYYNDTRGLYFYWWGAKSTPNNYTVIHWTLLGAGGSTTKWYEAGNFKVTIAGEVVYSSSDRIKLYNGTVVASGEKIIYHNNDGTKSFSASVEAGIYYVAVNCKGSGTWELERIARAATLTSAPNFNDEQNPTITFSNPAGNSVTALDACITFTGAKDDIPYRAISKTGTSYTFNLTDAERKTLRAGTSGNSRTVTFGVRTTIGSNVYYSTIAKTLTIINNTPTLSPVAKDIGGNSTALTGNGDKYLINGFNVISASTGAAAKKEATIVGETVNCGSQSFNGGSGTFNNITTNDGVVTFYATDSRGNKVSATKTFTVIPYFKPSINLTKNNVSTDGIFTIDIEGTFFNGSFGAVTNTPVVEYRWKVGSADWGNWVAVAANINGNNYSFSDDITGLNYKENYSIQVRITDSLLSKDNKYIESDIYVATGIPVFDWGKEDFAFNVPISIEGQPVSDFVIEEGTDDIWNYRKWNSGRAELWGRTKISTAISKAWGSMYVSTTRFERVSYPFAFVSTPVETATIQSAGNAAWVFAESSGDGINGSYQTAVYNVCRPSATSNTSDFYISYYVVGRWK